MNEILSICSKKIEKKEKIQQNPITNLVRIDIFLNIIRSIQNPNDFNFTPLFWTVCVKYNIVLINQ